MSAERRRVSQRTTKGQKPARYRSLGDVADVDEARMQRKKAEAELEAAEKIAKLKQEAIQLKMEVAQKKLALETAQAEEELALSSSRSSSRDRPQKELQAGRIPEKRAGKTIVSDGEAATLGGRPREGNRDRRGWLSDGARMSSVGRSSMPLMTLARPGRMRDQRPLAPASDSSPTSSDSSGEEPLSDSSVSSSSRSERNVNAHVLPVVAQPPPQDLQSVAPAAAHGMLSTRGVSGGVNSPAPQPTLHQPVQPSQQDQNVQSVAPAAAHGMLSTRGVSGSVNSLAPQFVRQSIWQTQNTAHLSTPSHGMRSSCNATRGVSGPSPHPAPQKAVSVPSGAAALHQKAKVNVPMPTVPEQAEPEQIEPEPMSLNPGAFTFQPRRYTSAPVKPLELPRFSGRTEEYPRWRQHFRRLVDDDPATTEVYKLAQLRECLMGGGAEEIVDGILDGPGAYAAVLTELDAWYGGDDRILERQEREILQWPKLKEPNEIASFALKLRTMLVNMGVCNVHPGRELYLTITQKFPKYLLTGYFEKYDDSECDVFSLSEWLLCKVHTMRRVDERLATDGNAGASQKPTSQWKNQRRQPRSSGSKSCLASATPGKTPGTPQQVSCLKCSGSHRLADCSLFAKMSIKERWQLVKENPTICALCFQPGHRAKECKGAPCAKCKKKHHGMLHSDSWSGPREGQATSNKPEVSSTHCGQTTRDPSSVQPSQHPESFMVVPVVLAHGNARVQGTALLDPASSVTYLRQSVASALNLSGPKKQLTTSVLGGKAITAKRAQVVVDVQAVEGGPTSSINAWVLPTVTASLPNVNWSEHKDRWTHIKDINFPKVDSSSIDVLIGLDAISLHVTLEERHTDEPGAPIARRTPLGWVCLSPGQTESNPSAATMHARCCESQETAAQRLEELVENFWRYESAGTSNITQETPSADDLRAEKMTNESIKCLNNRVEVSIPWSDPSGEPRITSNRPQAEKRLRSLQRSLASRPLVKAQYEQVMAGHLKKGYVRRVHPDEVAADGAQQWFLPHFPVVRTDKSTTKVRIVFDGAAKWGTSSINEEMLAGPPLYNDLTSVLLRFAMEPIALVGDISEMFLQVKLAERDQRYHRFLWQPDNGEIEVYQFTRVTFGAKASPYLAARAVKETLAQHGEEFDPTVVLHLDKDLYVDDLLSSVPSTEEAIKSRQQMQQLLSKGGFHMRKWLSNCPEVMESIPPADRSPDLTRDVNDVGPYNLPTVKTLGVSWDAKRDIFTFLCQPPEIPTITKRSVLRGLAKIFDPRGLISPFVIRAKVMLQDAWLLGINWDDPLPNEQAVRWQEWFQELPELRNLAINRCFKDPQQPSSAATLTVHCFTDASDRAIAAAVYVRAAYPDGTVRITLAASKAKPAPIKRQTIPQLELRAAVLGSRVSCLVAGAIGIPVSGHFFWTDSMNVLGWIQSHSRRYKVDIGNRISELQSVTKSHQWRHVPGKQNPADKATRGMSAAEICSDVVWHNGPGFLQQGTESWPGDKTVSTGNLPGQLKIHHSLVTPSNPTTLLNPDSFSTWERLVRVTAWCRRFINNCKKAVRGQYVTKGNVEVPFVHADDIQMRELTPEEMDRAERYWIAQSQEDAYCSAYRQLASGKDAKLSDALAPLSPEMDKSAEPWILKVGGRLQAAKSLPSGLCNPIILPGRHRITQLLIEREDRRCSHAVGTQHLLANLRQNYWIVNGTSAVKAVRHACTICRRNRLTPASQIMGPLPEPRVFKSLRPFSRTSVDFAGPYLTKQGRSRARAKRYICVFTCLECRACHLEMANGLSTDSFLLAFTRFIKRRGVPKVMISDNGTNFRAAEQELREAVNALDRQKIVRELVSEGIRWNFNPPRAPHFGGVVEILVKAAKRALSAILKQAEVTDEELGTAIVQAEDLINSRPLTVMSTDARDLAPLTPTHFLVGRMDGPLPLEVMAEEEAVVDTRRRWMHVQILVTEVWNRWLREFVPLLNVKSKWRRNGRSLTVGDIVLSLTNATPRGSWPLGRVTSVYPGPDNQVRVVDVLIGGKTYRRAIHQLVPIVDMAEN